MPTPIVPRCDEAELPRRDAIVIGAGLIGQAIACRLQALGIRTVLIDPEAVPRGASWGNAGHIAIEQVEPLASPATLRSLPKRLFWRGGALSLPPRDIVAWLPFGLRLVRAARPRRFAAGRIALAAMLRSAVAAWRDLLALAEVPELLREDGHFVVWETPTTAADGRARWQAADTGTARVRDATPEELAALDLLTTVRLAGAIKIEGSGQIADLGLLANALARNFEAAGGTRRIARVARLDCSTVRAEPVEALPCPSPGEKERPFDKLRANGGQSDALTGRRARAVLDDGTVLEADALIVAAGARSGELLRPIGHTVPIVAERGYHIQSAQTAWPADMPPVVFEDRSMIVTRFRSGLRAASFVEFGRADSPPDPRKWARLRAHVAALGLPFAAPGAEWMGARPTLPDYLPAIGRSTRADNLYYAFGHQHLGLTLAAITAEAVAARIGGETPPFDLSPFDLDRFGA